MKLQQIIFLSLGLFFLTACQPDNDPLTDELDLVDINELDLPKNGDNNGGNNGNPPIDEEALVELGRSLFWDPILSGKMDISCATCHHPEFDYADGRALSLGVDSEGLGPDRRPLSGANFGFVKRNSPTIVNTAFNGMNEAGEFDPALAPMFWDNREMSLEAQALGPIESFEEMRGHAFDESVAVDSIVQRLKDNEIYFNFFAKVFGSNNVIDGRDIGRAIAAFERTIIATDSPFDRFQEGDTDALSQQARRGMIRFNQIGCDNCHSGPMFSDYELHTLGVPDHPLVTDTDAGANGNYDFRTPTLRNLSSTGPYFHNGVGRNLQETIQFYRTARNFANPGGPGGPGGGGGGGLNINPNVNPGDIDNRVRNLNNFNNNDVQDIIAFIESLNDPDFDRTIPTQVPSGLPVGGNID